MAYYNPNTPYYPMNYYNPMQPGYVAQTQPTQSNDFIPIPSEEDARNFPMQRGTSVTFKDENLPYIYIKKLGTGQFDSPTFEVYEIKKRASQNAQRVESAPPREKVEDFTNYVTKAEYRAICDEIDELKNAMEMLRKELGA